MSADTAPFALTPPELEPADAASYQERLDQIVELFNRVQHRADRYRDALREIQESGDSLSQIIASRALEVR